MSNFVGFAWRHLMLKRSMQHSSAIVWTCTNTVLCFKKARYHILSQVWKTQSNRIHVQTSANLWYTGKPFSDGPYLVCSKKLTVSSWDFMICTGHSLKSKATTGVSPRLSALPAASSSVGKTHQALQAWTTAGNRKPWSCCGENSLVSPQQYTSRPAFPESRTLHRNSTYQPLCDHVVSILVPSNR